MSKNNLTEIDLAASKRKAVRNRIKRQNATYDANGDTFDTFATPMMTAPTTVLGVTPYSTVLDAKAHSDPTLIMNQGINEGDMGTGGDAEILAGNPSTLGIFGYAVIALSVLLFTGIIMSLVFTQPKSVGSIAGNLTIEQGETASLTYTLPDDYALTQGDTVTWYLNGSKVAETAYGDEGFLSNEYAKLPAGEHVVRAEINGKTYAEDVLFVGVPEYS